MKPEEEEICANCFFMAECSLWSPKTASCPVNRLFNSLDGAKYLEGKGYVKCSIKNCGERKNKFPSFREQYENYR